MLKPPTDESGSHMQHGHRLNQSDEAARLTKVADTVPPSMPWTQLSTLATRLAKVSSALLVQVTPDGPLILDSSGVPANQQDAAMALCEKLAMDRALNGCLLDATAQLTGASHPLVSSLPHVRFCLVLPVTCSGEHDPIWLGFLDREPRSHNELAAFLPALQALATHAGHLHDVVRLQQSEHLAQVRDERLVKALSETESRLNLIERTARAGSWSFNINTRRVQHSDGFGRILGLEPGETVDDLAAMVQRCRARLRSVRVGQSPLR